MTTFYIFRHGETFVTKNGGWYWFRVYNAPILDEGKPAIKRMAKYLKTIPSDINYVSPYLRCRQTADIVNKVTGKGFVVDKRIREYFVETPWMFASRIKNFLEDVERHNYKTVMICTHAGVITQLIKQITRTYAQEKGIQTFPRPAILTIASKRGIRQINFNKP